MPGPCLRHQNRHHGTSRQSSGHRGRISGVGVPVAFGEADPFGFPVGFGAAVAGGRSGSRVSACGFASGGTYCPNVGSGPGEIGASCCTVPPLSGRSDAGSRNANATTVATSTGTTNATAINAIRRRPGARSFASPGALSPGCPRCRPVTAPKRTHTRPMRPRLPAPIRGSVNHAPSPTLEVPSATL